jgi:hypothetical protein
MHTGAKKPRAPLSVAIVSSRAETLDGLQDYLQRVGASCRGTRSLGDVASIGSRATDSAIIFPDDFDHAEVHATLASLRRHRPSLLVVLVTREPQRYRSAAAPDPERPPLVVLPRPSLGWEIVDVLRAHARSAGPA